MNNLTPIENYNGFLFKREDLFQKDCEGFLLNGSKLRSILDTLITKKNYIASNYSNCIKIKAEDGSHTLINTLYASKQLGLTVVNSKKVHSPFWKNFVKHFSYREEDCIYNLAPYFAMNQRRSTPDHFVYEDTLNQVANIPKGLDNVFISFGSCQTLVALLRGFKKFGNSPNKIIAIGNKTPNPLVFYEGIPCDFMIHCWENCDLPNIVPPIELDTRFELKAWRYIHRPEIFSEIVNKKNLFWITGNYNFLREKPFI